MSETRGQNQEIRSRPTQRSQYLVADQVKGGEVVNEIEEVGTEEGNLRCLWIYSKECQSL